MHVSAFFHNMMVFLWHKFAMRLRLLCLTFVMALSVTSAAQAGIIRDTEIEDGFFHLTQPLAQAAGMDSITIRIVVDDSYNAYVMGGDIVYIHTGLLTNAKSTAEILGVIAHEIGHLAAGHAPRRAIAVQEAGLTSTLAAVAAAALAASGASGDAAFGVAIGGLDRANRNYLQSSRYDEAVADEWALRILKDRDIAATGLADFMRRLAAQRALPENRQSDYYMTHPAAGSRLATFDDHIRDHGTESPGITPEDDMLMQQIIGKIRAYSDAPTQTLKEALAAKREAANKSPQRWPFYTSDQHLYRTAIAHFRRGDMPDALSAINELRSRYDDNPYFHEFAGDIYLFDYQLADAITAYERAISLREAPLLYFGLGRAYLASGNAGEASHFAKAADAFAKAVSGEPRWPALRRQLAIALGRNGQLAQADIALSEEALLLGDKQRAIQMAKRALAQEAISKESRNRANDILFSLGGQD